MHVFANPKIFSALAVCFFLAAFVFTNFVAQNTQHSPTPLASPTASATPTPTPTPSPTPLPGAHNFHQWGSITLFNGLPSDSVRAISQTLDGVMWFGTDNGLARFDGRRIQNFSLGEGEANRVLALETAPTGGLWIGTRAGAFVYSENRFQPIEGTLGLVITAILLGREVFLGTDAGLVLRVKSGERGTYAAEKVFPDPIRDAHGSPLGITSLVENEGELLAGTAGRGVFIVKVGGLSELPTAPRPIFVNSIARGEAGELWLGTDAAKNVSGIYTVESRSRAQRVVAPTANVLALESNESGLWAGTERNGLFHIAESKPAKTYTFENTSGGLRSDTIFTLFTDREGVIWIGTNRGVSRFDRLGPFQQTVSDIPNSNFIRSLFRTASGSVWAGSNRGLFESENDSWKPIPGFEGRVVHAIAEHSSTKVLIGTSTGLFSDKLIAPGDIRGFATFRHITYAAVVGRGILEIPPGQRGFGTRDSVPFTVVHPDPSTTAVSAGIEKLWIGTIGKGLFSFDGREVKLEVSPDVLKSGAIWRIFENTDRSIWIAGEHGVLRMRDGQPEKIIDAEDVRDVYVDGEHVWAATTTRGLMHARHDEQFGWLAASVGFEQGLPSEKAFSILPVSEGLLIATNRGVVTYKPGSIAPKLIPTRILSQRIHDLSEMRSAIELDYPQNSLLVEVAGQSSRTFPEEFQYAFLLKNAKGKILDSRLSNEPQYAPADLKPGNYTIESLAFDRDLLSSEALTVSFAVAGAPFPWTATALGVLLTVALVALFWAILERRMIVQRNRELAAARADMATEAERERGRIARELHDQTLADLRNLMMKSDRLLPQNSEFRSDIESVSNEIRRICEDLSPSVLENVGLVAALEFLLSSSVENHRFLANDGAEDSVDLPLIVQLHIYRIAQEILTNIVRHSNADVVEMSVAVTENEQFSLNIKDNGKSFQSDAASPKGRGISNIRSRASMIDAKIAWSSTDGENLFSLDLDRQNSP